MTFWWPRSALTNSSVPRPASSSTALTPTPVVLRWPIASRRRNSPIISSREKFLLRSGELTGTPSGHAAGPRTGAVALSLTGCRIGRAVDPDPRGAEATAVAVGVGYVTAWHAGMWSQRHVANPTPSASGEPTP